MQTSADFYIKDFNLDEMVVVQHHRELGNSSNKPMLTTCINSSTGIKEDVVVKLNASERMSPDACMKETVASLMALTLGISSPWPVKVLISDAFVESRRGSIDYDRYKRSQGLNFGTKYIKGLEEIYPLYQLPSHLREEALKIFFFDLLIQNVDRTLPPGKPNLFTDHYNLYVLDHELGYVFLDLLFAPKEKPWEIGEDGLSSAKSHILYASLRHKHLDFSGLNGMLIPFLPQYWHEIGRILPSDWQDSTRLKRIEDHVAEVQRKEGEFIKNIQAILK